jgi:hypothetical protein
MKIKISENELKNLIIETIQEEMFVIRRKIEILSMIIENFDVLDCSKPMIHSYQRVYCGNLKKYNFQELVQLRDTLRNKFDDLIKQEIRNKRGSIKK